jgi:uncharacterized coiled-coil protein SlyX
MGQASLELAIELNRQAARLEMELRDADALIVELKQQIAEDDALAADNLAMARKLGERVKRIEDTLLFRPSTEPPSIEPGEVVQVEAIVQVTYHRSKVAPSQDWYIDAISEAIDPEDILGWRPTKP